MIDTLIAEYIIFCVQHPMIAVSVIVGSMMFLGVYLQLKR